MLRLQWFVLFIVSLIFIVSCQHTYISKSLTFQDYKISKKLQEDTQLNSLIRPYADSVHRSMNDVIATAAIDLEKKQPESPLGNLLADIMLKKAQEKYVTNVDGAIINYGGIRLPSLAAGDITRGKVFELAPFDNIVVLQILDGHVLQLLLDHIASKGGWPIAGITFEIKNKNAIHATINGQPISPEKKYTIALLDYVANGGDNAEMLRAVPQINHGFLFRDQILEYMIESKQKGVLITSKNEKRVSYAE